MVIDDLDIERVSVLPFETSSVKVMGRDGIEPSTSGLKVVHLAPCDAEAHYDTRPNTLI
jgi:hypothetical protein